MKKIILGLMAVLALTACDPSYEKNGWDGNTVSAEQLAQGITIKQYGGDQSACDGNIVADGNWIEFATNPSKVVRVYYIKKDGSESDLSVGKANGLFYLKPSRGSDPQLTLYFETLEFDGSSVTASKNITLAVATELTPEMKLLCSNKGKKIWKWDLSVNGQCWGNCAYATDGDGLAFATQGTGQWWGVNDPALLWSSGDGGQFNHTDGKTEFAGEGNIGAYMEFDESGTISVFDKDGKLLRSSKFEVKDYSTDRKIVGNLAWHLGTLKTDEPAIMFPYMINGGGKAVNEFQIMQLSATNLVLIYAGDAAPGAWKEATYWRFTCDSDAQGILTEGSGEWTWDLSVNGQCWGNCAYATDGDGLAFATQGTGQWWGVGDPSLLWSNGDGGQFNHTDGKTEFAGEGDSGAYMKFLDTGEIETYDKDGNKLRSATYEIEDYSSVRKTVGNFAWHLGMLKTSAPAILYPYMINGGGKSVSEFQIMNLTSNSFVLVYPSDPTPGAWKEATYWRFKKK